MNWLDVVFIVVTVVAAYTGMKNGLLGTAFTAIGVYIGCLLAGQYSGDFGEVFSGTADSQTWVTVISYCIIIIVTAVVTRMVWRAVKPILTALTLGLVGIADKLGGLVMGLLVGIAISCLLIVGMARLTYSFESPKDGISGTIAQHVPDLKSKRAELEEALFESAIVPILIKLIDNIPAAAFGLIPDSFGMSVDILRNTIDELDIVKGFLTVDFAT